MLVQILLSKKSPEEENIHPEEENIHPEEEIIFRKEALIHLKNFLDKEGITGIEDIEIPRRPHEEGQMGAGTLLNSIATMISAATEPLTALVKCLQKYVENYRTVIRIRTKNGDDIVLEHGRGMTSEQLKDLVVAIQNSANNIR